MIQIFRVNFGLVHLLMPISAISAPSFKGKINVLCIQRYKIHKPNVYLRNLNDERNRQRQLSSLKRETAIPIYWYVKNASLHYKKELTNMQCQNIGVTKCKLRHVNSNVLIEQTVNSHI